MSPSEAPATVNQAALSGVRFLVSRRIEELETAAADLEHDSANIGATLESAATRVGDLEQRWHRLLQKLPDVDGNRIGIYGLSYGGLLTALALARNSDVFKAGVDVAGVHNWATTFDHDFGKPVGTPEQRKVAMQSTAIAYLDTWRSPVLISQGDDDRNVPFSQGVDLATRLRDRGVYVETQVFPNETHENQLWQDLVARYQTGADFLARFLKP